MIFHVKIRLPDYGRIKINVERSFIALVPQADNESIQLLETNTAEELTYIVLGVRYFHLHNQAETAISAF